MVIRIARKVGTQLLTASTVALVVLALYVMAGRQLMPMVDRYDAAISEGLAEVLGMPVKLRGLQGQLRGFSPQLSLQELVLSGGESDALTLRDLTLVLDVPRSMRSLQPILSRVQMSALDVVLVEQADGGWLLDGLTLSEPGLDAQQLFELLTLVGRLQLLEARIVFQHRDGSQSQLERASLEFASRSGDHHLLVDAITPGGERLQLIAHLHGQHLSELGGELYLTLPRMELAPYLNALPSALLGLNAMDAGAELWASIKAGALQSLDGRVQMPLLALQPVAREGSAEEDGAEAEVTLHDISATLNWRRIDGDQWALWLYDLSLLRGSNRWPVGMLYAHYQGDEQLGFHADALDAGMATALMRDLRLLPAGGQNELDVLNPRGSLQQLSGVAAWRVDGLQALSLRTNLENLRVSARGAAPAVWGLDGYAEVHHSADSRQTRGFVEVDSRDLMLHLPNLFDDIWAYDRVNGRVNFQVDVSDGLQLRVDSSVVAAESEMLNGRAQFATEFSRPADADWPEITLELMVGALEADIAFKSRYLPMAAGAPQAAQGILSWVDEAVRGGSGAGSGFLFRGHVHRGAPPASRTLQMFYHVDGGEVAFDPEWPPLEAVNGHVVVNDRAVDILVSEGSSLGIGFSATTASVRAHESGAGHWLSVNGRGRGESGRGLQYLAQTPVTAGLGAYFANWETDGDVDFSLELAIPLFVRGAEPNISLRLGLDGNRVRIPEYDLDIEDVNGELHYHSAHGLASEGLVADFFGERVAVDLRTGGDELVGNDTRIEVQGRMPVAALADWSMQPMAVRQLLTAADGSFDYRASLTLPQQRPGQSAQPGLHVRSDLQGMRLDYPAPLGKSEAEPLPLDLQLSFAPERQEMRLRLDDLLSLNARLQGQGIERGLLFFSPPSDGAQVRRFNNTEPGLEILGVLPELDVLAWFDHLRQPEGESDNGAAGSSLNWRDLLAVVSQLDVNVERLALGSDPLLEVNLQMSPLVDGWQFAINSEAANGRVGLPADESALMSVEFDHIHLGSSSAEPEPEPVLILPGNGVLGEEIPFDELETVEYVMPREDPLINIDPRNFPAMQVRIDEIRVGATDYGRWRFRLEPDDEGVVLSDLSVLARGLAIGSAEQPATFRWDYAPGQGDASPQHHSSLAAVIGAGDLGGVLSAYGYAPVLISSQARFEADLDWHGSPAFFSAVGLNGDVGLQINDGRFMRGTSGAANNALKLISIANFDAVVRRLRFSDDLVRQGLGYDEIRGRVALDEGIVTITEPLQIIGPSSLFQIRGKIDLPEETIDGTLNITLPVSENIPWLSGLAMLNNLINWQVAIGVFLLDRIFGDQVDNLTSAQYILQGPWDGLEPRLTQAFGGGNQ